jgi:hypothetical protein
VSSFAQHRVALYWTSNTGSEISRQLQIAPKRWWMERHEAKAISMSALKIVGATCRFWLILAQSLWEYEPSQCFAIGQR